MHTDTAATTIDSEPESSNRQHKISNPLLFQAPTNDQTRAHNATVQGQKTHLETPGRSKGDQGNRQKDRLAVSSYANLTRSPSFWVFWNHSRRRRCCRRSRLGIRSAGATYTSGNAELCRISCIGSGTCLIRHLASKLATRLGDGDDGRG